MEKISIIEAKLKQLMDDFTSKTNNLSSILNDIDKYTQAKGVLQQDLHVISGAIQAYQATVDLFKGNPGAQATVDSTATPVQDGTH